MKKALYWIGAAGLALAALVYSPSVTVSVPEAKVRSEVAMRLPMTIEKNGVNILVRSATVDFLDDNKVHIKAEADLAGYGLSGAARADATSGLRYEGGAFYLADLGVGDIEVDIDQKSASRLSDIRSAADGLFKSLQARVEDASPGAGSALEALRGQAESRFGPAASNAIEEALATIPVYDLHGKDLRHDLAALALEDVSFSSEEALVRLSPGTLVLRLLLGALALVLALLGGLGWVMAVANLGRR